MKTKGRPRKANSMMCKVEEIIERIGASTVDDVSNYLPGAEREQIIRAMLSLKRTGRLVIVEHGEHVGVVGTNPSTYGINKEKNDKT